MAASGRIAWHPAAREPGPVSRWVSLVFLQGQEADEVLAIIDRDGADAAIEHLAGFDMGEETIQAALVNGYVYDTIPTGPLDRTTTNGIYTLTYNHDHGHVSLFRALPETREPDAQAPSARTMPSRPPSRRHAPVVEEDDWFARRSRLQCRGGEHYDRPAEVAYGGVGRAGRGTPQAAEGTQARRHQDRNQRPSRRAVGGA
ncbi:hypothetical protein [Microbacterium sp. CH12i]|uniref:hypothetical protein n=1 Tax=Microbacterium sp. CH12i TaxID=1479651 RepID=UPI002E16011F